MLKSMHFDNIDQIRAHRFVGNAYSDMPAFMAINYFVEDERYSVADRAEAIRHMTDYGMGAGRMEDLTDEELVARQLADEK